MKYLLPILTLLLALLTSAGAPAAPRRPLAAQPPLARPALLEDTVYVCPAAHSRLYHCRRTCPKLTRCSHALQVLDAAEAEKLGKRICRKCIINKV